MSLGWLDGSNDTVFEWRTHVVGRGEVWHECEDEGGELKTKGLPQMMAVTAAKCWFVECWFRAIIVVRLGRCNDAQM